MTKPTVNIGCGNDKWGDYRLDINPRDLGVIKLDIEQHLPYPDKFFSEAKLSHVLEHCDNPQGVLAEAIRVSDRVHALFPAQYDILPWGLTDILAPMSKESLSRISSWMIHRFRSDSHPMKHHWRCQPFGRYTLRTIPIPIAFTYGRKARVLRKLTLNMAAEWDCWYP